MSAALTPAPQAEWFLARDGQQFGPLSDQELRKLVELGHLKPSDLLWREGFPEWRSARILLPETAGGPKLPAVAPTQGSATSPAPAVEGPSAVHSSAVSSVNPAAGAMSGPASNPNPRIEMQPAAPVHPASVAPQFQTPSPGTSQYAPQAPARAPVPANSGLAQSRSGSQEQGWALPAGPTAPHAPAAHSLAQRAAAAAQAAMATSPSAPVAAQPAGTAGHPQPSSSQMRAPATVPIRAAAPAQHPQAGQQRPLAPPMATLPQPAMQGYPSTSAPIADSRSHDAARPAPRLGPQAAAMRQGRSAAPIVGPEFEDEETEKPRTSIGRWIARIASLVFFVATLSAAGLYAYPHREDIATFVKGFVPSSLMGPPAKSPLVGFSASTEATDAALQAAPLWRTLKREFPEWYAERIREASALARDQKAETQIAEQMMGQVMALRRKHAGDALSATSLKLKGIAASFAENLVRLRDSSIDACHGFITSGETHPAYLKVLGDPVHTGALQVQLASVFEAVAEGRKVPRVYPQPKEIDFNTVVELLRKRGWSNSDMRLFSDSGTFAKTEPEKMCKMVIDWFEAQLEIKDGESQIRLLSDALRPVIAG